MPILQEGGTTPLLVSTQRTRLTGLGQATPCQGALSAESVSIDLHGNQTVSRWGEASRRAVDQLQRRLSRRLRPAPVGAT